MDINTRTHVDVEILTMEKGRAFFDARCRELLTMSGDEFLAEYDSGVVWERGDSEAVTELAMLVPFAR